MRSKAPLALIEQAVMVLVFALAAALCLRCFVWADQSSRKNKDQDRAVIEAQTIAETLKSTGGDFAAAAARLGGTSTGQNLMIDYADDWERTAGSIRYTLGASRVDSDVSGLAKAEIWARDESKDEELLRFQVAWQEVSTDG